MAERSKHAFLVGYAGDNQTIYGREEEGKVRFVDPMTLHSARQQLRRFPLVGKTVVLYRLVPVERRKVTREDSRRWLQHGKREGARG